MHLFDLILLLDTFIVCVSNVKALHPFFRNISSPGFRNPQQLNFDNLILFVLMAPTLLEGEGQSEVFNELLKRCNPILQSKLATALICNQVQ